MSGESQVYLQFSLILGCLHMQCMHGIMYIYIGYINYNACMHVHKNNIPIAGSSVVSSLSLSCFKGADVLYKTQFIAF